MSTPVSSPPTPRPDLPPEERRTLKRAALQALGLGALTFAALGLYLIVLKWRGHHGKDHLTWTEWDELVPFQPVWVWVYLIPYVVGPALVGLMSRQTFAWFVPRALAIMFLSVLVFIVYPTQTGPRPPLAPPPNPPPTGGGGQGWGGGPTHDLYKMMIEVDEPPANAAPSLHVSLTCLLALALFRDFPRWWPAWLGGTLLVWAATLFTRQHHLIDVATGALLACAVVLAWPWKPRGLGPRGEP
jgi:membrane-associated phospholipid phosphatase